MLPTELKCHEIKLDTQWPSALDDRHPRHIMPPDYAEDKHVILASIEEQDIRDYYCTNLLGQI